MPKLKWGTGDNEPDWSGMEDEEYTENDFPVYEGPLPPKNTMLEGQIKKIWAVVAKSSGNYMFKVLFEAEDNKGDKAKYNGLSIWENVVWTPGAKFKWQPFLDATGTTLKQVKQATITAEEDDNVGTPVLAIYKTKVPMEVRILTGRDKYDGDDRAVVQKWMPPAEEIDDDDEELEDDEVPF